MNELSLNQNDSFLQSLGLPRLVQHHPLNHFDFSKAGRRILVIGPMGSGKTEYSARVWRDSLIALKKSPQIGQLCTTGQADRRKVFFVRSSLDSGRFLDYPADALAYRGGYERLGGSTSFMRDSFELEELLAKHPQIGTWIIDEASFYDERLAWVVKRESEVNGRIFIFPTLILNFRREIFNTTARFLIDTASDLFALTAYCEHPDCLNDATHTYRYYLIDGQECPAPYFDPLLIVGGDRIKNNPREPNYCARCEEHHYLPGKEYTFLVLKPLGQEAMRGNCEPLQGELTLLSQSVRDSALANNFIQKFTSSNRHSQEILRSLDLPCLAERALLYLFTEAKLLKASQFSDLAKDLSLDRVYLRARLRDCGSDIDL